MSLSSHIVPPSQIQEELDALWNAKDGKKKVKASLFNVIFFTKKSHREEYLRKVASNLIQKFPARVFFISSNPDSPESSLKTAVSIMTTEQGEFSITCDQIEIAAQGNGEKQVPFILLPHIIPDLPTFLVWSEDPVFDHVLCDELSTLATRIIFDSESAQDLSDFSKSVEKIQNATQCEIADLNWARLEGWRDLLSDTFDDLDKVEKLKNTSTITITYNSQETPSFCHTKIQAIYLQAWIASRMRWVPDQKRSSLDLCRFHYDCHGRQIEVQLKGDKKSNLPPGMILSLDLKTIDEDHFIFTRDENTPHQISVICSTKQECCLPVKFLTSKDKSGQSLIKEICHKGTSQHYLEVLHMISKWNRGAL